MKLVIGPMPQPDQNQPNHFPFTQRPMISLSLFVPQITLVRFGWVGFGLVWFSIDFVHVQLHVQWARTTRFAAEIVFVAPSIWLHGWSYSCSYNQAKTV